MLADCPGCDKCSDGFIFHLSAGRPTSAHEHIFLLTKSARYYYDAGAIREPSVAGDVRYKMPDGWDTGEGAHGTIHRNGREKGQRADKQRGHQAEGRNKRDVWEIATQGFSEAHFATFPEALVSPCILAGSKPGDVILDPFGGAGTVSVVARKLGRRSIYSDLNPDYAKMAKERLQGVALAMF